MKQRVPASRARIHLDIARIAGTYHAWRGDDGTYKDIAGFCKVASLDEVSGHGHVLTPGRYVGAEAVEEDEEPFIERISRLTMRLNEQFDRSVELQIEIRERLKSLTNVA